MILGGVVALAVWPRERSAADLPPAEGGLKDGRPRVSRGRPSCVRGQDSMIARSQASTVTGVPSVISTPSSTVVPARGESIVTGEPE